jgi:ABC-type lipoprotein export system ATPase subunit
MLAFGMALIHKPKLLLFDEPFSGVDSKYATILLELFKTTVITIENAIIIVEHKDDAKQLFNRRIKMELGSI